ncbi:DUF5960 family protein [Peptoniphilus sp. SGI.035]|uniref:DUF5960 family protein n=1 Tax=Peptoniphilus sp. SGI.035 TaxID=3420564 RepID=UPI003D07148B
MNNLENSCIQFDYFSCNYKRFEEDFYKFSAINVPLTFLTDDLLLHMFLAEHDYFRLNAKNSVDDKDHYFVFKKLNNKDNKYISQFEYIGNLSTIEFF